ncbi:MAG: protein kinase [Planctomycetaceae bacterium]|nr:protein kinase [Planctomycetaceae bacterium]
MSAPASTLIEKLTSLGLMSRNDLEALVTGTGVPFPATALELAELLRASGQITEYQADVLVTGRKAPLVLHEYHILDEIGRGGMGTVYRARHRTMERIVAVKLLRRAPDGEHAVERFQREIKALAALSHPRIVTAHDAGMSNGTWYLVMEFIPGTNASDLVRHSPLSAPHAVAIVLQAAEALAYAHERSVIHRDVKPSNLMIHPSRGVIILDLGLARIESAGSNRMQSDFGLTDPAIAMGTVDFMSPEQGEDTRTADRRSDIYSLGCTLYFLLTRRVMYPRESLSSKLGAHRVLPVPDLRSDRSDIPSKLAHAFATMVAKDPEERFQTMDEVIEALRPFSTDLPATVHIDKSPDTSQTAALISAGRAKVSRSVRARGWIAVTLAAFALGSGLAVWHGIGSGPLDIQPHPNSDSPIEASARVGSGEPQGHKESHPPDLSDGEEWESDHSVDWKASHGKAEVVVLLTPDGQEVVSGGFDGTLRRWNIQTGRPWGAADLGNRIRLLASSSDSRQLIVSIGAGEPGRGQLKLLKTTGLEEARLFRGHEHDVTAAAFFDNDRSLVTGSLDTTMRVWNVMSGAESGRIGRSRKASLVAGDISLQVNSLAVDRAGKIVACGRRSGTVERVSLRTGEVIASWQAHEGPVAYVAVSPQGNLILSIGDGDHAARLWNTEGVRLQEFETGTEPTSGCLFVSDATALLADRSGTITLLDLVQEESTTLLSRLGDIVSIDVSRDGRNLVLGDSAGTVQVRHRLDHLIDARRSEH